jgi:hypothetical protein
VANKFEIQVVALDRFTGIFRRLNNNASKAVRPLTMTGRQLGALARETHLDKALSGINKITQASTVMARTLGVSLGPLESLLGIGAAGGIIGGLGAAAIAATALGVRSARVGYEVARTSNLLGVGEGSLQRWRGAAKLAGGDADTMTETMFALRQTMQDSYWGRDPAALAMFNKLGFRFRKNAQGALDVEDGLIQISRAMERLKDPAQRAVLAEMLHLPPDAIWVLEQGPQKLEQLMHKAEQLGMVMGGDATQQARTFTDSLNELKGAAEGLANSWGNRVVPSLIRGMDAITHGINTGGLAGGVGGALSRMPGYGPIPSGIRGLGHILSGLGSPNDLGPDSRTISGIIGGPTHQGPLTKEDLALAGAMRGGGGGSSADAAMRAAVTMTPEEIARGNAQDQSAANIAELRRAIASDPDPAHKRILSEELNRIEVSINLGNAPPGTTASARSSNGSPVSSRVQYAMPNGISP